jgi:hypothetical protein
MVRLLCVVWVALALAGSGTGVSAVPPPGDEPQRGVEYLAIIYPAPGQCFPSAEGIVLSMALAPHVYSRWPRDKDAGELCCSSRADSVHFERMLCASRVPGLRGDSLFVRSVRFFELPT